jgi:tRNA(Ile2) C34 agmatinyltransferase TiaS
MSLFMIVGGIVLGLGMVIFISRSVKKEEAHLEINGKSAKCPKCQGELIPASWVRTNNSGTQMFRCRKCHRRSEWNCTPQLPACVDNCELPRRR